MLNLIKTRNFWFILAGDTALLFLAYFLAYYLRFEGKISPASLTQFTHTIIWLVPCKLSCFFFFNMYKGMWRYTSIHDLISLIKACVTSSAIVVLFLVITVRFTGYSRSIFIIDFVLTFLFIGSYRVGIRLLYTRTHDRSNFRGLRSRDPAIKNLLLIGAGSAGEKLLREILENPTLRYDVVGFLDDDLSKIGHSIHGVPVLDSIDNIERIVETEEVDEIIIAISTASADEMRRIVNAYEATGLPCKTLPGIAELIEGKVSVSSVREIRYEDLLGRTQVNLNMIQVGKYLAGKRVMVTGGAGSIGSELCRQIIRHNPEQLIVVDMNESSLYEIEMELAGKFPTVSVAPVLGLVHIEGLMKKIFQQYQPQVVFHAAAYKHVPMMEMYPREAIFNNILGTQVILSLCARNEIGQCVVVSTDKAVRPTNVMGASKRLCELLTVAYQREYGAKFMAVRFGNVVGSRGSVLPLFQKQIQRGGPLTVTDPEVTRYFMTIPEASRLILQAGAIGTGGEIFILKMGVPIRIADMARDIIRLSGLKPYEDIEITYTGLRPGEKLSEELITEGEGIQDTEHEHIMVLRGDNAFSVKEINKTVKRLVKLAETGDAKRIKKELKRIVPEYEPWRNRDQRPEA